MNQTRHRQGAVLLSPQRDSRELFGCSHRSQIHLPSRINLKENKFRSAIDHRFVARENVEAKHSINVGVPRARIVRMMEGNQDTAKTDISRGEILSETHGEFLTIDLAKLDVTQTALRWLDAE